MKPITPYAQLPWNTLYGQFFCNFFFFVRLNKKNPRKIEKIFTHLFVSQQHLNTHTLIPKTSTLTLTLDLQFSNPHVNKVT